MRVAVLFGGRSAEHEVSLRSAAAVIHAIDRSRFEVLPIQIRKDGRWEIPSRTSHSFLQELTGEQAVTVAILPDPTSDALLVRDPSTGAWRPSPEHRLDVIFPVLHGTYGEDGTIQGLLDLAGIPYVGAGTTASALAMDKEITKAVFRQAGLPVVASLVTRRLDWERSPNEVVAAVEATLSYPAFVKPANMGSSVGVTKVAGRGQIAAAMEEAFLYDSKALVEQGVDAREIEVSVLGHDEPAASVPGEIVPSREFYDYRAKYIDDTSELIIPAPLGERKTEEARALAIAAFRALGVSGMARVDFFLERRTERLWVNELNTIPGFTSISMYPKLWEASGMNMTSLVNRLIHLAIQKHDERLRLKTDYPQPSA